MKTKSILPLLAIWFIAILLGACDGAVVPQRPAPTGVTIYTAQDIDNRQIHFVWLEVPEKLEIGSNDVRVFMARTDPPGMLVPTEVELPCIVQSEDEYLEFRAETLPFEFDGSKLEGSYVWKACASCIECYMNWDTRMEIVGTLEGETMALSIGIRHLGHNIIQDYTEIDLLQEEPTWQEPAIKCRRTSDCMIVEFLPRP